MAGWAALLAAYLIGGVTFIPLTICAVLIHGFLTLPYRNDLHIVEHGEHTSKVPPSLDTTTLETAKDTTEDQIKKRLNADTDVAAGYFAVCREYTPMGINAKPMERSTPIGSTTVLAASPSVYQTMYRSIFDRKPTNGPLENNNISQRPKRTGNIFYVVLRHGHLMLFDDDEQLEVRHVISLAHHVVSIYSGDDVTPEGELFIKRNALCLSRKCDPSVNSTNDPTTKPFYLFSENCSAKEDFYFALLRNQQQAFGNESGSPKPHNFELRPIISLVQRLHSSEDQVHSRWLNAIVGRLFLGVYKTRDLENIIHEKITKKISRVNRPSFLTNIKIQGIETGDSAPYFSNLKLKDLTVEGECVIEADVKYTGNCRIEVAATAKIDLGARFKAREVNLVLAVVLKRVEGHVYFKIKPPPSNRVWFSFQVMPKLDMVIEPIVSSRQITYAVILRQIENRIKEVFAETVVQPFWDDTPFFKTEHKKWRGGIFEGDDAVDPPQQNDDTDLTAKNDTVAADTPDESPENNVTNTGEKDSIPLEVEPQNVSGLVDRKANRLEAVTSAQASSTGVEPPSFGVGAPRSPNIIKHSTEPLVGTETTNSNIFRPSSSPSDHATSSMAALHSKSMASLASPTKSSTNASPSRRSSASSSKEEPVTVNEGEPERLLSSTTAPTVRRNTTSSVESGLNGDGSGSYSPTTSTAGSFKNQAGSLGRSFFLRRENSNASTSISSTEGDGISQKKNTLAAVTNAAAQAKQWGWNAIQRQREAMRNNDKAQVDLSQPIGRGQPLPPPGTPLPGPLNGSPMMGSGSGSKWGTVSVPNSGEFLRADHEGIDQVHRNSTSQQAPTQRRRRGGSQQQEEDIDQQNILVVAAPDDSQPGTPATEDQPDFNKLWAGVNGGEGTHEGPPIISTPLKPSGDTIRNSHLPRAYSPTPKKSPTTVLPFSAGAVVDDDDDFSGWMEDVDVKDEVNGIQNKSSTSN